MTNKTTAPEETPLTAPKSSDNSLSIVSLVLGLVSLTGPGLIFGIPAIILGAVALKKKQGERGLSITGIVTGAVSTLVSLLLIGLVIFFFIWGVTHPEEVNRDGQPTEQRQERFDLSST